MDNTVIVALIGSSGSVLIGVTALLLNYRGFVSIDHRLDLMQADMKDLNKAMTALEIGVALLKGQGWVVRQSGRRSSSTRRKRAAWPPFASSLKGQPIHNYRPDSDIAPYIRGAD